MAVTGTVLASGRIFGTLSGQVDLFLQWAITNGIGHKSRFSLANGNNPITILTGTTLVAIVPPSNNTFALTLKGNNSDTGIPMGKTAPYLSSWDTSVLGVLTILSAGIVTVDVWMF